jgi:Concanavalin A-like lectin/glucanases superfamily
LACEENWTESFFAKFDSLGGEMTLLDREGAPDGPWRHRIFKSKENRFVLQVGEPSVGRLISGPAAAQANRWNHVALVADGNRRSLFIDGVAQGNVDIVGGSEEPYNRGWVTLGASRGVRTAFHGLLDEIAWYERALDGREVITLARLRGR